MSSFSAGPNGQLTATTLPPQKTPAVQAVEGGILNAATAKSVASNAKTAEIYKSLGAGQKGGKRKYRGGGGNVPASPLPTAGSIPGVSHQSVMQKIINNHNDIVTAGVYDKLGSAQPKLIGGSVKRRRSTKKHGRKRNRTHRRRSRRNSRIRHRSRRTI